MDLEIMLLLVLIFLAVVFIAMLAGVIFFGYRLIKTYPIVSDPKAPGSIKAVFWLAVLYTLSPIDLLPDPIWIDDMIALLGAFAHISGKGAELGLGRPDKHTEMSEVIDVRVAPKSGADRASEI